MKKILWVDDDHETNRAFQDELEINGYSILRARDPDEMMEIVTAHGQDFGQLFAGIIIDVLLPVGSQLDMQATNGGLRTGLAVIEHLEYRARLEINAIRHIPIIIFTIRNSHDVDDFAAKHKITCFRKQETSTDELLLAVQEAFYGNC